jgi:hypothetical protein
MVELNIPAHEVQPLATAKPTSNGLVRPEVFQISVREYRTKTIISLFSIISILLFEGTFSVNFVPGQKVTFFTI